MSLRPLASAIVLLLAVAQPALARKDASGRPSFKAADPEAYYIWHDPAGWHLRITTGKKPHAFHGVLRGEGIAQLKPTRASLQAKIEATATTVRFDFELREGLEGFDWQATSACMTWELKLDGLPKVDRIHVGARAESPSAQPFDACG